MIDIKAAADLRSANDRLSRRRPFDAIPPQELHAIFSKIGGDVLDILNLMDAADTLLHDYSPDPASEKLVDMVWAITRAARRIATSVQEDANAIL